MPGTYAAKTEVSVDKSQIEIKGVLQKHGATAFQFGESASLGSVEFELIDRRIRILIPIPQLKDFRWSPNNTRRTDTQMKLAHEQGKRQVWRILLITIKAKLEAVACGIATLEEEFLPHIVVDDNTPMGTTLGELVIPRLKEIAAAHDLYPLLPAPKEQH